MPFPLLEENPYTRRIVQTKTDAYLKDVPEGEAVRSNHTNGKLRQLFIRLTGLDQKTLESFWSRGKSLTSCNGFVGIYGNAVIPPPKPGGQRNFGMFDLPRACRLYGVPGAWIKASDRPSARPGYGDIVKWTRLHVSVSLEFRGSEWHLVEGGQGGPSSGFDSVVKHWRTYDPSKIEGWVSLVTLFDAHLP